MLAQGSLMEEVYIVGVGQLPVGKYPDSSPAKLGSEAVSLAMSDAEMYRAEQFIELHFNIIAPEQGFSLEDFYKYVDDAENERGEVYDTTAVDPFNDLNYDLLKHGGRQDLQLEADLHLCKNNAKKNKRINFSKD